jgi:hypothetical protein
MPKRKKAAKAAPAGMAVRLPPALLKRMVMLISRVDPPTVQQPNSYPELPNLVHLPELLLLHQCLLPVQALPPPVQYLNQQ